MTTTETTVSVISAPDTIETPRKFSSLKVLAWVRNNPILYKEMQSRMRSGRTLGGLTIYTTLLAIVIALIYSSVVSYAQRGFRVDSLEILGRAIFFTVYSLELIVVCMSSPASTAGTISGEKEQQTYDLLRTTLLSARDLVLGKLLAANSYVLLFILVTIPLQAFALIFGGLTTSEIIISQIILVLTALAFGSIGIFYSSFVSKSRLATGFSQLTAMSLTMILPALFLFIAFIFDDRIHISRQSDWVQFLYFGILWLVGASSPIATAFATEVFFIENSTLIAFTQTLSSGTKILIPSPWLGFIVIYPIMIALFLYFSVRNIQKIEKE